MFEVRPSTIAAGESTEVLFDIRQAMRIRITPADDELTSWNRRFAAAEGIQNFKQSARVRPQQTTTYTITATVMADPRAQSFTTVSQSVTVTVIDTSNAGQRCSPGRYNFAALDVPSGSLRIVINKTCADGNENFSMAITYAGIKVRPLTASYSANGDVEETAMKKLTLSRSLPSGFTKVIVSDVYPVLEAGDLSAIGQKKINIAVARALRSVR